MTISQAHVDSLASSRLSDRLSPAELIGLYRSMLLSRFIDDEEIRLKKRNQVYFQVSSAGHEAIGVAAAFLLRPGHDWFFPYYRDRAMCLHLGITPTEMMLSAVGAAEDPISGGRQMPAHWGHRRLNIVSQSSPTGTQYSQAVGVAEGGRYIRARGIDLPAAEDEVVLVSSGEGATSEGEFWEALNVACNGALPVLFLVEDNEYAISVPVEVTTAGGDIGQAFSGLPNLMVLQVDGNDLAASLDVMDVAVRALRAGRGPVLVHAKVTRPYSHSLSDDQVYYRTQEELSREKDLDCLLRAEKLLIARNIIEADSLADLKKDCLKEVRDASERALKAKKPDPSTLLTHLYSERQLQRPAPGYDGTPLGGGEPLPMAQAINRTLLQEMTINEKILVFGEDVADCSREKALAECKGKGGVFKVTYGLQREFGNERVFNSMLAEASIIARSIGMAVRGLKPVPEIQFLDFIWPAFNQIRSELATMRYRSAGAWGAAVVVRVPVGGYLRGGAMYHSQTAESIFASCPGIKIAYPSNAADAMGLLRAAMRMDDPVLFFEHKHLYLQGYSRANDPGPDYVICFGRAKIKRAGSDITILTWGALVQRCLDAVERFTRRSEMTVEVIDLRTLVPLDEETIRASVRKTGRVLIAHEEFLTAGFGAEIAARVAQDCFEWLDAPVKRIGARNAWVPYSPGLEEAVLPQVADIEKALEELADY